MIRHSIHHLALFEKPNVLTWKELIPYKGIMVSYFSSIKLSKKLSIEIANASITSKELLHLLKQVIQTYIDNHSIDVATISKVPDEDIVKKKSWYTSTWLWIVSVLLVVGIFAAPNSLVGSLSESRASTVCYDAWEQEVFGSNHTYYSPVKYKRRWAINTGERKFRAVVEFTAHGVIKRFSCDVFLEKGEVMYRVTNHGK
jgi:hypothetical protein